MEKINFKKIINDNGLTTTMANFGRLVGLSPNRLREIYKVDRERFFSLLSIARKKYVAIYGDLGAEKQAETREACINGLKILLKQIKEL